MSVIPFQERGEVAFVNANPTADLVNRKPPFDDPRINRVQMNVEHFRDLFLRVKLFFHISSFCILQSVGKCVTLCMRFIVTLSLRLCVCLCVTLRIHNNTQLHTSQGIFINKLLYYVLRKVSCLMQRTRIVTDRGGAAYGYFVPYICELGVRCSPAS